MFTLHSIVCSCSCVKLLYVQQQHNTSRFGVHTDFLSLLDRLTFSFNIKILILESIHFAFINLCSINISTSDIRGNEASTWQAVIPAPLEVEGPEVQRHPSLCLKQPFSQLLHHHLTWSLQLGWRQQQTPQHWVYTTWCTRRKQTTLVNCCHQSVMLDSVVLYLPAQPSRRQTVNDAEAAGDAVSWRCTLAPACSPLAARWRGQNERQL